VFAQRGANTRFAPTRPWPGLPRGCPRGFRAPVAVSSASCRLRAPGLRSDLRANNSRSRIRSLASDASSLSFSTFSRLHARSCSALSPWERVG
jgi:hypothetical protein